MKTQKIILAAFDKMWFSFLILLYCCAYFFAQNIGGAKYGV